MKLISSRGFKESLLQPAKPYAMLDDAEMALQVQGEASSRLTQILRSPDLLTEYASCASLIMDKAEREEVARQLINAQQRAQRAA